MKILILVVLYNPIIPIEQFLLTEYDYLIIDNSEIPSFPYKKLASQHIHYIANNSNLGIAKSFNLGCQYALDHSYQWIVTLDQDSNYTREILNTQIDYVKTQFLNPPINRIAVISPLHILQNNITLGYNNLNQLYFGINTMSSGNLINLKIWQDLGGFLEYLFIDMVDTEYYCRAIAKNYLVLTLNNAPMQHNLGKIIIKKFFTKNLIITQHNAFRRYSITRNTLYVYFKYRKQVTEVRTLRFFVFSQLILMLLFEDDKLAKTIAFAQGIKDFIKNYYKEKICKK